MRKAIRGSGFVNMDCMPVLQLTNDGQTEDVVVVGEERCLTNQRSLCHF